MASPAETPTEHERHNITLESDLIIIIKESKGRGPWNNRESFICVHEFAVSTAVMREYKHFGVISFSKQWADTGKDFYEVRGDDPAALEIWLQLLHGCLDKTKVRASISTVWNLLVLAQKYNFDGHCPELKEWFFAWYDTAIATRGTTGELIYRMLLYPCYYFNHAEGFAAATKYLAYNMQGHIEEKMPAGVNPIHKEHHMKNNRVIGSLNSARGSLRTKLHSRIYDPCWSLLGGATCKIKEKVFYQYHKALKETGAWPIEIQGYRNSINELFHLLGKFKYEDPHPGSEESCETPLDCMDGAKFSKVVANAIERVGLQFDGLCLDCMNVSGNRDEDDEYWKHNVRGIWEGKCRIQHGQSTWYFSFLGRREKMDKFQKKWRST